MSDTLDRGTRFQDGMWDKRHALPPQHVRLFAQAPRAEQRFLFTPSTFVERATEPPCDHPETEQQRRLGAPDVVDDVCVSCGAVVDDDELSREPDPSDWIPCKTCGHDMYVHARPGYGGCSFGEGCKCARFESSRA